MGREPGTSRKRTEHRGSARWPSNCGPILRLPRPRRQPPLPTAPPTALPGGTNRHSRRPDRAGSARRPRGQGHRPRDRDREPRRRQRRPRPVRCRPRPRERRSWADARRGSRPAARTTATPSPMIATEAGRCAVSAVELEPVTRADVESAAETARRASNCARIPRFQHLQRLPHGLAAPPTALAADAYSGCRTGCRTANSSCRTPYSACRLAGRSCRGRQQRLPRHLQRPSP